MRLDGHPNILSIPTVVLMFFFSFVARVGFDDQDNIVFSSAVAQFDELSTYGVFGGVPVALNTSKVLTRIQRPSL